MCGVDVDHYSIDHMQGWSQCITGVESSSGTFSCHRMVRQASHDKQ